jgi:Immunity protein 50
MTAEIIDSISGASKLVKWFGCWPSFHDAEILNLTLDRSSSSKVRVHTFSATSEIDENGYFVLDHHVVVTFWFEDIVGLNLSGFNFQNVIAGIDVERTAKGCRISFAACYGLSGEIEAKRVWLTFQPGKP